MSVHIPSSAETESGCLFPPDENSKPRLARAVCVLGVGGENVVFSGVGGHIAGFVVENSAERAPHYPCQIF